MNLIHSKILKRANEAAIYTLYLSLAHKTTPSVHGSFQSITADLETAWRNQNTQDWNLRDVYRLHILKNAIKHRIVPANSRIINLTHSENGLTACSFINPSGDIFVAFRGTGSGEWIDNGEGLSGIPEENTYITYDESGKIASYKTVQKDHATDQQVEALNWFHSISAQHGWNADTRITLCGHSKGGNKAQFITIHSDLVDECFSFDGQGFSPEALTALKEQYGPAFAARRRKIRSFAADNDYVNVLGQRLMPDTQIYYFESSAGFHYLEAMLNHDGGFHPQCEQGRLSQYVETASDTLMGMDPSIRQYATLGVMNIFQKHLGNGVSINSDAVSIEKTIVGIGVAIGTLLHSLS